MSKRPAVDEVLADLWNGDIALTAEERRWTRQALDAQERAAPALEGDAPASMAYDGYKGNLTPKPCSALLTRWAGRSSTAEAPHHE